ncbi:YraN family protein [Helicobacter sp. T3_23-1056]
MDKNLIKNTKFAKSAKSKTTKNTPKNTTKQKGKIGEDRACAWLESNGFKILERNFFTRFGEIDIIALEVLDFKNGCKKDIVLHFIEVKNYARACPAYAISPKKLDKIYKSIDIYFLKQNTQDNQKLPNNTESVNAINALPYCVSAILIQGEKINFLTNVSQNF